MDKEETETGMRQWTVCHITKITSKLRKKRSFVSRV